MAAVRDTYLIDYGLTMKDAEKVETYCRNAEGQAQDLILQTAREVYPGLAKYLFFSLTTGIGYTKMGEVPMQRKDFQGYRRKCIAVLSDRLKSI